MHNLTPTTQQQESESSSKSTISSQPCHISYRNWLIGTKVIDGRLWIRWQHPAESFPRYNYPVGEKGLAETIRYVRFLIDMAIKLEQDAAKQVAKTCVSSRIDE